MKNKTRNSTEIDKGNYPSSLDLTKSRADFAAALASFEEKKPNAVKETMGEKDPFYLSAKGYFELRNVIAGKASLGPTIRALNTLRALSTPPEVNKRLARQGLAKAMSLAPIQVIGCLHTPEPTPASTIIMSGIIVAMIVTIAAFWYDDYTRGHFNRRHK